MLILLFLHSVPVLPRRKTFFCTKFSDKTGCIHITDAKDNFLDLLIRRSQVFLYLIKAEHGNIINKIIAGFLFEKTAEIGNAKAKMIRRFLQAELIITVISLDIG